MLTRRSSRLSLLGIAAMLLTFLGIAPATAAACDRVCSNGVCVLVCSDPGSPGDSGGGDSTGTDGDNGGGGGGGDTTCEFQGHEVPCSNGEGAWAPGLGCWLVLANPQKAPPPGKTDADGNWYRCIPPPPHVATGGEPQIWRDGPVASWADPAELARRALASLNLQPIDIGIVPKDESGKLGLIGLPTWMWVENPSATTYGPASASASDGPITVNLTAQVDTITWTMGDGSTVSCEKGTPYDPGFGDQDSPDCGHRYEQTSAHQPGQKYTVTATSHWIAEWAGGGQSGTIEFDLSTDTQIQIGEMQVLTQ